MPSSDDEFSAFDFSEFTEDDLKQIDAGLVPPNPKSSPKIIVELEASPERPKGSPKSVTSSNQPTEKSPYQQHRRHGVLSVTDLASLAWFVCSYLKRKYILELIVEGVKSNLTMAYVRDGLDR